MIDRLKKIFNLRAAAPCRLTWDAAQRYELDSAITFMQAEAFREVLRTVNDPAKRISRGHRDPLMFKEFFANDESLWNEFVEHITDKSVMEIGPCVATAISTWDVARCRYVVEPLYLQIVEYQNAQFSCNAFGDAVSFTRPAEELVEELVGKIDGALVIRNCIDHSPRWPFILSNVADYLAPGGYLLLWNDLMHGPGYELGHFDITDDVDSFRRLVKRLGFDPILEYIDPQNPNLNWGCLARKTGMPERA